MTLLLSRTGRIKTDQDTAAAAAAATATDVIVFSAPDR